MIEALVFFLTGLILLVKSSDWFVEYSAKIAAIFGVSDFFIGLTIVGIGTNLPELATSIFASLQTSASSMGDVVIGTTIGSNIANIGLITGLGILSGKILMKKPFLERDGFIMLFSCFLAYLFMAKSIIPSLSEMTYVLRIEGIILLCLFVAYLYFLIDNLKAGQIASFKHFLHYFFRFQYVKKIHGGLRSLLRRGTSPNTTFFVKNKKIIWDVATLLLTFIGVIVGAKLLLKGLIGIAESFQVSKTIIAITGVAIGTSLPELGVSISAIRKGATDIFLGNIIGSNITNIFLVLGISAVISPVKIPPGSITFTVPYMILLSILLLWFLRSERKARKIEGWLLLLLYGIFLALLWITGY
ncbi:calcium/sodium antiporter [Candidatus Woesearchaeota archaeon]|nr:calcium/sodium antiporter [Candidatus Woesearchaeota archaeon]